MLCEYRGSMRRRTAFLGAAVFALSASVALAADFMVLQPLADKPGKLKNGRY